MSMSDEQEKTHPYHWVMVALSLISAGLYVASFFHRHFRVLYDKYIDFVPSFLIPVVLGIMGYTFGMGLAGLIAPESFWKSSTAQKWILVGSFSDHAWQRLLNRLKCLVLAALGGVVTVVLIRLVYIDY
jgi:hypothetical protein